MKIKELFNLEETIAKSFLEEYQYPWECLDKIHDFIMELGESLDKERFKQIGDGVWVAKTADISNFVSINGPTIIDENAEIRHCAFIRGNAIIGKNTVVGNSTEVKNSILFNGVEVPHFNYIGDSILGYKAHMGAGSITSNVKSDKSIVKADLKKVGAFLGDGVEIGCNSVLNPGTIVGKNSIIYPLSSVRGTVPENSIYKSKDQIVDRK